MMNLFFLQLIFVKEYTCAEGESYHVRHFCCFHCDDPLGGKQYIPKDGQPVCLQCFQVEYGKVNKIADAWYVLNVSTLILEIFF